LKAAQGSYTAGMDAASAPVNFFDRFIWLNFRNCQQILCFKSKIVGFFPISCFLLNEYEKSDKDKK
jgi:hypothetical protein